MKKGFIIALVLLLALPSAVLAAPGDVTGTFGIAEASQISEIRIYESDGTTVATSLTPQQDYIIEVDISDADGIGTLDSLHVKLWYDANGDEPTNGEFDDTSNPGTDLMAWISWYASETPAFGYQLGTGSWGIDVPGATLPNISDPGDTGTQTVRIPITVGKLAQETSLSAKWQIGAEAVDQYGTLKTYAYYDNGGVYGLPMNWYGEIQVEELTEVDWGNIPAGTNYSAEQAEEVLSGAISYLSNGSYGEQVKAADQWTKVEEPITLATLVADPISDNDFGLKVGNSVDPTAANQVSADFITVRSGIGRALYVDGEGEVANIADDYHLFIQLAPTFSAGTYSGSITFGIFNDHQ